MVRFIKPLVVVCFFCFVLSVKAGIPVGSWRTHFCYNDVSQVVTTDDAIYAVANGKLFSVTTEGAITIHTTLTGLNGFDVAFIGWSDSESTLVIVYSDGNIDFLSETGINNLPDFRDKSMTADKTVYNLRVDGQYAFISTGVGLLLVDIERKEISDSYKPLIDSQPYTVLDTVYDAVMIRDSIYLMTPRGVFAGNTANNLLDPSQWSKIQFLANKTPVSAVCYEDQLYVLTSDGICCFWTGTAWISILTDSKAQKLLKDNQFLYVCASNKGYIINADQTSSIILQSAYGIAFHSQDTLFYVASGSNGLLKMRQQNGLYVQEAAYVPNGPSQVFAWNAFVKDGVFYSTTGSRWGDRNYINGDILRFDGETWTGLKGKDSLYYKTGVPFMDLMNLAIDPDDDGHFFITSWGEGLYEFRDSVFYTLHNQYNSSLVTMLPGRFCRVDGATFDNSGNLWVLNSTYGLSVVSDTTLWVLKPDGSWIKLYYEDMPAAPTWGSILFTSTGQVWCNSVRGASYGIFVLDQNNTTLDTSDDDTRWFSTFTDQDGSLLSPFTFNCMAEDLNGSIWIGTNLGPIIAANTSNIFNSSYTFTRVKIPRNDGTNTADYLLKDIRINCIAIDGANRKWLGTAGNGLYLLSSDGTETIHRFTTENSPLPSDYILSITVHPETGEVFAGTSSGLVSYRSDATEGEEDYQAIRVFPNPVRPGYAGKITVTGLKENTQVRITDLNGNLLAAGTSLGGQFGWSGLNQQGTRVASGVYLVFCASEDGTEYQTCKFMIVN